jgi:5'-3' exonuclease
MNEKKYDVIFVDTHNLYFRNFKVYKNREEFRIKKKGGVLETGGIHGSLISILKLRREKLKPNGNIVFLADNSTSIFERRQQLDPSYKSRREQQKESFYRHIDYLISILHNYIDGDKVIRLEGVEADDLAPVAIEIEDPKKEKEILVVSTDMDWSRLIDYRGHKVEWFNGDTIMTPVKFLDKYGFLPSEEAIIIYKSFHGDESDFIPNAVKNLPTQYLKMFVEEKTVKTILNNINLYSIPETWKKKILEASPRIMINESLVSFLSLKLETVLMNTIKCKYNKDVLKSLFENINLAYNLHPSLLKDIQGSSKDFLEDWDKPLKRKRA